MSDPRIPAAFASDVDKMPPALRALIDAELAVGNEIAHIGHSHPAPPIGAYAMLARPITTRSRETDDVLRYRARNSSLSAGEFTDAAEIYFVLEPAGPPPEEPDMDAIRTAANTPRAAERPHVDGGSAAIDRFFASMVIDYDKWHDGEGYDIEALRESSPSERVFAECRVAPPQGWRDVEALAALAELGSATAEAALRTAAKSSVSEVRLAVLRQAPLLVDVAERTASLVRAMEHAAIMDGLDATLAAVEEHHPPAVIDALWRGLLTRDGDVACNYAGMVAFLEGEAESSFDWLMRPLFLKFNTTSAAEREAAFRELCVMLGKDADAMLAAHHA